MGVWKFHAQWNQTAICTSAQSRQSLHCLHIQSLEDDEGSGLKDLSLDKSLKENIFPWRR